MRITSTSDFLRFGVHLTELYRCCSSDGGRGLSKIKSRQAEGKEEELRAKLKSMLSQTLMLRGISAKYLTSGGTSDFADQMLKGSNHKTMLGLSQCRAVEDLKR